MSSDKPQAGALESIPDSAVQFYRWPREVCDLDAHPAKRAPQPLIERRQGPRSDSHFARLAEQ